ncbi:1-deoxy-D-xylulose-5-phosphate reductoisomerase [Pleionea sp. CnH1-48]|uniref:1-deoxy-D-xylulose-5-phosphate reductoisomerase n=1 Tax=Pleionea sp. CnH1-48 TaxID=2954494 RepID=UPI002096E8D6|nr:1-deoxy-D-xylulose-5-phosphate reductoisomerase [Pleionea sp. CnH1-48]MCO7226498.1 1-deoxy-D-xylulose-5-phosphate reductoisomerase [Pleionea sp. CnH1-48]
MQKVTVLGATGSIGVNTLDVIKRHPDDFQVYALTAHSNISLLLQQAEEFKPAYVVVSGDHDSSEVEAKLAQVSSDTRLLSGLEGLVEVAKASEVDVVMAAIVGAAGLLPTLAAAESGKKVLLANKESLVVAGKLMMQAVRDSGATLLPIDSEHNAIFQCLPESYAEQGFSASGIQKILLTGSGGPFRTTPIEELDSMTPEQACAHPNWSMGRKISVDSATMMNKGLEVIEACHLFDIDTDQIEVVLHPQSIIHSMVSYADGSVLAQMGQPDMRTPIAHALSWPQRIESGVEPLDFLAVSQLSFSAPDFARYPCLKLAFDAYRQGGAMPTVLNAANEVAVAAFLDEEISFMQIAVINERTMVAMEGADADSINGLIEIDQKARSLALKAIHDKV